MSASHERHSIATRALLLAFTTAVILLNTRVLGASGQGEIAWIQLGILVVTGVSGFLAGGAVVYLQKEIPLRAMLLPGIRGWSSRHCWAHGAASAPDFYRQSISVPWPDWAGSKAPSSSTASCCWRITAFVSTTSFRSCKVDCCWRGCWWLFSACSMESVEAFIGALAVSLCITAALSILWVAKLPAVKDVAAPAAIVRRLWKFGRSAQTGALLQMLTNRSNLSILAQSSAGLAASGVYSIAYYGLEAMWLVPRALAPLVYTRTAAEQNRSVRLGATRKTLGQALLGTASLLAVAVLIPDSWFAWAFGFDGIQPVVHALAPAALFGAVASIVAHHLSGIGKHHWNAATSGLGLIALLVLAREWVPESGAVGAAWAASAAAAVQCTGLLFAWWRCER